MISSVISHYRVLSKLGAGGMGEVYLAQDTRLDRLVAIKFLPIDLTRDAARLRRFEQEARAVSALNHPNIVTIFEIGEVSTGRFIVLEYVKGRTLRAIISGGQGLAQLGAIGRQVANALAVAHDAGMVHRDIKPENIMVRDDGWVKVLDFGLARLATRDVSSDSTADTAIQTRPGTLIGTVAYMSPEQVKADPVGSASDVFSIGVVLYEMATGRKPFKSGSELAVMHQIAYDDPPRPTALSPDVPLSLETLILRMLDKNPLLRPSAADVAAALAAAEQPAPASGDAAAPAPRQSRRTVGRAAERGRMRAAFHSASAGHGLIVCVTGETGLGKTTLVEDFLSELTQIDSAGMIARGRCSERLAGAEAYLPVLEALENLAGTNPSVAATMKATAPSWYVQLAVSRDPSVERIMTESPTVSQERMKRELAAFLQAISNDRPLVLFFDDLHWADASTVDTVAYLATRLSDMRLLIVATYRPAEMLMSRHPFLAVVLDMQARGVCQELPLAFLTPDDVDQYLAQEFPQHVFPNQFASLLFTKTEGNPLFMTDVVRYLRDRRVIGSVNGRWALVQSVPEIDTDLPATVRSLIQRKISQLDDVDRRMLLAASTQGYVFDSAAVARALGMDEADVEERLQSLEHTHGFVTLLEDEELPDHTLTLKYRFVHVLYQNALYGSLTPSRKAAFSASIAEALLAFHGERSSAVASELAFLFETARDWQRAAEHFLTAARNAARIFANQEAISLCRRGLDVNRRTANTPDRARQELRLQMTLGFCLMTVKGFAATDTLRTFLRAEELCRELGDETQLFRVLFGLSIVSVVRAEYVKGRKFADACLQHARQHDDGLQLVQAHWVLGLNLQLTGDFAGSREHFEQSIARYEPRRHAAHAFLYGGILNRLHLARVLLYLGHPEQADARMKEGLHVAETLRHPVGLVNSLSVAITIEAYHRNTASILAMADRILFHADEHGLPYYAGIATIMRGWARAMQGEVDDGCAEMRAGLAAHRGLETEQQRAYYLVLMGEALCAARRTDEALDALDEAADLVRACEEHFCEAELHRVRGEVLTLAQRRDDALTSFRRSIEIARTQGASGLELRAAMSFARAASEPACRDEAIAALRAAYDRFAEGFETTDLQAARAFL